MKSLILGIITCLVLWPIGQAGELPAEKRYSILSEQYINSLLDKNYQKAYSIAAEQLDMDPSDAMAYLRLAIAAHHLEVDKTKVKNENTVFVAEGNALDVQIKQLANALLAK